MNTHSYPFSAILSQDAMKTALLLNAVDPGIGGVLIRGQKGTAKSTAARALAALLPEIDVVEGCPFHCPPDAPSAMHDECAGRFAKGEVLPRQLRTMPLVELPLSATEDRVVGTLHLEHALKTGERRFEPGLLATANRGILYVDEVNLLSDHLVDLLLDVAASGVNLVEREGVCYRHPARFLLVGTMNPEEGELRPQFLDRFGLCVTVRGLEDVALRRTVVLRRIAFEEDPAGFCRQWVEEESLLAAQVTQARQRRDQVAIPEAMLDMAVRLAIEVGVHGHRADIAIIKSARALAALLEKSTVSALEIAEAARLVLPHRMSRSPLDTDRSLDERIETAIGRVFGQDDETPTGKAAPEDLMDLDAMTAMMEVPGATAAGSILFSFLKKKSPETLIEADHHIDLTGLDLHARHMFAVRRRGRGEDSSGRVVGSRPIHGGESAVDLALVPSLRAAIRRGSHTGIAVQDLHRRVRRAPHHQLVVFVVDASESMGEGSLVRMAAAKGAVLALLKNAYVDRCRVALVAFHGEQAEVLLPPTRSIELARERLKRLPVGGATPFADGLWRGWQLIRRERSRNPGLRPLMVVISDGEANVPLQPGRAVVDELLDLADRIHGENIPVLVIDSRPVPSKCREMERLAQVFGVDCHRLGRLRSIQVLDLVRDAGTPP